MNKINLIATKLRLYLSDLFKDSINKTDRYIMKTKSINEKIKLVPVGIHLKRFF